MRIAGNGRPSRRAGIAAVLVAAIGLLAAACVPSGTVDASYGGPGGLSLPCDAGNPVFSTQGGGAVVVACTYVADPGPPVALGTRLLVLRPDGTPDPAFDGDGQIEVPLDGATPAVTWTGRAADGSVLVAGSVDSSPRLYRFRPDGSLDTGFGSPATRLSPPTVGYVPISFAGGGATLLQVGDLTVVATQDTVTCGGCGSDEGLRVRVFGPTGALGPATIIPLNSYVDPVPDGAGDVRFVFMPTTLAVDSQYRLVMAGAAVTRYTLDGSIYVVNRDVGALRLVNGALDPTYGTGGLARIDVGFDPQGEPAVGLGQEWNNAAAAISGGAVTFTVLNTLGPNGILGRLDAQGQLDATFDGDGLRPVPGAGLLLSVAVDWQQRSIVTFTDTLGPAQVRRFLADGSPDPAFGTSGSMTLPGPPISVVARVSTPFVGLFVLVAGRDAQDVRDARLFRVGH